jgi:hypothetical protein
VPTAVAGETPNSSTSNGVISDPPPTPVMPTTSPTRKPENVYIQSMRYCQLDFMERILGRTLYIFKYFYVSIL